MLALPKPRVRLYPQRSVRILMSIALIVLASVLASACGGGGGGANSSGIPTEPLPTPAATVAAPTNLITPGSLSVGTDPSYLPMEFIDPQSNNYVGFDIDLANVLAQRMGLKLAVKRSNFNTLLDDLDNKRFDIAIAAITINSEREQRYDFIPYFKAGESLLVKSGNPLNLKSVADLCGHRVGAQNGTVEQTDVATANAKCKEQGKPEIQITILQSQTDVIQLLANGRVDATFQDSPVTDYYNKIHPGQFEVGGSVTNAVPYGIAFRKGDSAMKDPVQNAFNAIRKDGTYDKLFTRWGFRAEQKIS